MESSVGMGMKGLRDKTIRGALYIFTGRAVMFVVRMGSIVVLARLLDPTDYGLVGMVTAFTGVLNMFGSFGLFQTAVQRDTLTEEQASTLFWANVLFGALVALATLASAPIVGAFYREPRLVPITCVVASGFLITAAGVQHGAHLQRQMRFGTFTSIEVIALLISTTIAIGMALTGCGYWALVSSTVTLPLATTSGLWLATAWMPGLPQRNTEIRSMLRFGGAMTLNGLISAVASNSDKLLLGRVWGAEALGIYGRAFHLSSVPNEMLNATMGEVAFAALCRTKDDVERRKRYFLKAYSLIVALTVPVTIVCALFADDVIAVILGPKWTAAAEIFRILSPSIIAVAVYRPLGWLLTALGLVRRALFITVVLAPIMIAAVAASVPFGPKGVGIAYSAVTLLQVIPIAAWALHGTGIRVRELMQELGRPLAASLAAALIAYAGRAMYGEMLPLLPRLVADVAMFGTAYVLVLLLVGGQNSPYLDLFRAARAAASTSV